MTDREISNVSPSSSEAIKADSKSLPPRTETVPIIKPNEIPIENRDVTTREYLKQVHEMANWLRSIGCPIDEIKTEKGLLDLTRLEIRGEQIIGLNELKELPKGMYLLKNLTTLVIADTDLREIPESICELKNLNVLDISNSPIEKIPETLSQLTSLTELTFSNCKLKDVPENIGELQNLVELDLSHNELVALPSSITTLTKLEKLDVAENRIEELPEKMGDLDNLIYIDLRHNELINLPQSLLERSNKKLTHIHFLFNFLPDEIKVVVKQSNRVIIDAIAEDGYKRLAILNHQVIWRWIDTIVENNKIEKCREEEFAHNILDSYDEIWMGSDQSSQETNSIFETFKSLGSRIVHYIKK